MHIATHVNTTINTEKKKKFFIYLWNLLAISEWNLFLHHFLSGT